MYIYKYTYIGHFVYSNCAHLDPRNLKGTADGVWHHSGGEDLGGFPVIKEGWEIPERNGSFLWESHRESWENVGNPRSKWRFIVCSWENHRTKCVDFPASHV